MLLAFSPGASPSVFAPRCSPSDLWAPPATLRKSWVEMAPYSGTFFTNSWDEGLARGGGAAEADGELRLGRQ